MPRALITGVSGQDGAYLAALLVGKGYEVVGTSRSAGQEFQRLSQLGIGEAVTRLQADPADYDGIARAIAETRPDEIYHLAGQSSVGVSFERPAETLHSIVDSTLNILEAIAASPRTIRAFFAGSSDCYGDTGDTPANEDTAFRARSPYAVAKSASHGLVATYRETRGLFACTGIAFNHESPLRSSQFVSRKIVDAAVAIANRTRDGVALGTLDVHRDWGYAPEYVEAMWRMLQSQTPSDYIIATGHSVSLRYFVERTFEYFGLNWRDWVQINNSLIRSGEIRHSSANPKRIEDELGWKATVTVDELVRKLCTAGSETARVK